MHDTVHPYRTVSRLIGSCWFTGIWPNACLTGAIVLRHHFQRATNLLTGIPVCFAQNSYAYSRKLIFRTVLVSLSLLILVCICFPKEFYSEIKFVKDLLVR